MIVVIGFITAFAGALLGLKERHFKKILAYSTIESLAEIRGRSLTRRYAPAATIVAE